LRTVVATTSSVHFAEGTPTLPRDVCFAGRVAQLPERKPFRFAAQCKEIGVEEIPVLSQTGGALRT
jgi:hypothetical protein